LGEQGQLLFVAAFDGGGGGAGEIVEGEGEGEGEGLGVVDLDRCGRSGGRSSAGVGAGGVLVGCGLQIEVGGGVDEDLWGKGASPAPDM